MVDQRATQRGAVAAPVDDGSVVHRTREARDQARRTQQFGALSARMRVNHEDLIQRLDLLQEALTAPKRRPQKRK
jgi:hypothetical protein